MASTSRVDQVEFHMRLRGYSYLFTIAFAAEIRAGERIGNWHGWSNTGRIQTAGASNETAAIKMVRWLRGAGALR